MYRHYARANKPGKVDRSQDGHEKKWNEREKGTLFSPSRCFCFHERTKQDIFADTMTLVFMITPNGYVRQWKRRIVMRSREYCYKGAFSESKKGHSFLDQRFDCSSHHLFIYSLLSLLSLTSFTIHPPSLSLPGN